MDRIAERLSVWFGSTPFIVFHVIWFIVWFVLKLPIEMLTLVVSLEAIFLALFILRAENIQGERLEKYIKEAVKTSQRELRVSAKILREIKDQRYMK